jgi:hypothetical protein
MSLSERMTLPGTTLIKLNTGRMTSLAVIRSEHQARFKRFATAASLGRSINRRLTTRSAFATPRYVGSSAQFDFAIVGGHHFAPGPTATSGTHLVMGQVASGQNPGAFGSTAPPGEPTTTVGVVPINDPGYFRYAKDYKDFCSGAAASACIYLPANTLFAKYHTKITNAVTDIYSALDTDPLILDTDVCASGGGIPLIEGNGCGYLYPINYFANFQPGNQPTTLAGSCNAPASYYVDPKGALRVNYIPSSDPFSTGATPITCAVQIWVTSKP